MDLMCQQIRTEVYPKKRGKKSIFVFDRKFMAQSKLYIILFCNLELAYLKTLKSVAKGILYLN